MGDNIGLFINRFEFGLSIPNQMQLFKQRLTHDELELPFVKCRQNGKRHSAS
jgi:hypothetical protein